MTVLPIRLVGDPVLREAAVPVTDFDAELRKLVDDLSETLTSTGGAGLAAPQLGVGLRVFALNPKISDGEFDHLVNPVLEFPDEEDQDGPEGCLSIPGIYLDTRRRMNVVAKGYTKHGDPIQLVGEGLLSRCVQHETDHLDGVLFIDRQRPEQRDQLLATIRAAAWAEGLPIPEIRTSPH
ncbi:peptide deformylase [Winogradskya humida]|uniref:Peptide deformylase n=1 Tax=Winogradskya humida TaxID=113566 RepID=A0ABQ3ZXF9_9ACTN|nr:peptide deformylase [Actinoplanes humidus]GIE23261.1 peptide deformylase 1 [Actinoplanes humidus]